jgi:hypothetical protein
MIDKNKKLKIPREEKLYISKEIREALFLDLINVYQEKCQAMTLVYAYINTDSSKPLDYILLFRTRNTANTTDLIVYDAPLLYSDRSIPGYRYCKRTGIVNTFIEEAVASMVRLSEYRFREFIELSTGLEYIDEGENSWMNAEYATIVADKLLELSTRYTGNKQ